MRKKAHTQNVMNVTPQMHMILDIIKMPISENQKRRRRICMYM